MHMKRRRFLSAITKAGVVLPAMHPFAAPIVHGTRHRKEKGLTVPGKEGQRDFFFRPADAWAADFIPLFSKGEFQLFYLHDFRDEKAHGEGTPWYRISTKNLVDFTEHGEA